MFVRLLLAASVLTPASVAASDAAAADRPHVETASSAYDQTDVRYSATFPDCARGLRPTLLGFAVTHPSRPGLGRGTVDVTIDVPDLTSCHVMGDLVESTVAFRVATRQLDGDVLVPGLGFARDYNLRINGEYFGYVAVGLVGEHTFHPAP